MVVIISIDGCRPDAIRQSSTPNLDQMVKDGSHTWTARTVMPSVTLPCHNSMFRSVPPERHGITSNVFTPLARPVPSLFDAAAQHGKTCGMFYNWHQLRDLAEPDSVQVNIMHANANDQSGDTLITEQAITTAKHIDLDFVFLYLGHTDSAGHDFGWMSDEYLDAVSNADRCIGRFVDALIDIRQPLDIIILSDHGGHDRGHGTDSEEDMTIPFIMYGYRCEKNFKINRAVSIMDAAPTAAHLLGIPRPPKWEGTPVLDAIRDTEQSEALKQPQKSFGLESID